MSFHRVAVTGGSGFIGSHVVDHLVDSGHEVVVLDPVAPHRHDVLHSPIDIFDIEAMTGALAGCQAVFHLAAMADVNDVAARPDQSVALNVQGTSRVWEAARRAGVTRSVLASTVWVYSAGPDEGVLTESTPLAPDAVGHLYTATKLAAEMVVHGYHTLYGQEYTILRYGIPYGPRMRPALVIPKFVDQALNHKPISVQGDGSQYRNYVYVGDLARAHVMALEPAGANQVFNLEGQEKVSVRNIVEAIGAALGRPLDVDYQPARTGDYTGRQISADRAAEVLGWVPEVLFTEGLRRYFEWYVASKGIAG